MTEVATKSYVELPPSTLASLASRATVGAELVRWIGTGAVLGGLAGWFYVPVVRVLRGLAYPELAHRSTSIGRVSHLRLEVSSKLNAPQPSDQVVKRADVEDLSSRENVRVAERNESPCAPTMRLVEGDYCTTVVHQCVEPFTDGSGRCRKFAPSSRCYPPIVHMRYCIDAYEFPNVAGTKPLVMVDFTQATALCAGEHKRLCTGREWTLACEGTDRLPYPYGYVRDPEACNVDLPHRFPDTEALSNPKTQDREVARLDQRVPSGSLPRCVSTFGVLDMVGNVDEWVTPDGMEEAAGAGGVTALKGGYFGPVRARCRPSTVSHGATFKFYQVGFRCCANATER